MTRRTVSDQDLETFKAEIAALEERCRTRLRLPGDGKIDMGEGRRLYPCEANAERDREIAERGRSGMGDFWRNGITRHYHAEPGE